MTLLTIILITFFVLTPKQLLLTAQKFIYFTNRVKKLRGRFYIKLQEIMNHFELQNNIVRAKKAEKLTFD